ncbi:MAG: hypothetical protein A2583_12965 [Bdellovibrionales bacterium RIFOXYD1_FULL_53_11]|nr:MAG: hypothetical protein A2583_12965 [Bdellovibrionales bacterium RIFOXYD1_FULL_53_11]
MDRDIINKLRIWKKKDDRKPLVLKGARQVGKTFILKKFGEEFRNCHYINFEKTRSAHALFDRDLEPVEIIRSLETFLKISIEPDKDLIIFDEIQECPLALTSLKYFAEERPDFCITAAGSLLGVRTGEGSFPVGKVDIMEIFPMSFSEFLTSTGDERLIELLTPASLKKINEGIHSKIITRLTEYMCVGGLPEVVLTWVKSKKFEFVREKQSEIIEMYMNDIAKHSGKVNAMHIRTVFESIPSQLARELGKFVFKDVIPGRQSYRDLASPIDWLVNAGLIYKIKINNKPQIPLDAYTKENTFKLYYFDVGILGAVSGFDFRLLLNFITENLIYKGFFLENLVLQELVMAGLKNRIYSWVHNESEIEFLTVLDGIVVPIEVKTRKNRKAKSLSSYIERYSPKKAIRLSLDCSNEKSGKILVDYPAYMAASF